jgi:hypothetical protein
LQVGEGIQGESCRVLGGRGGGIAGPSQDGDRNRKTQPSTYSNPSNERKFDLSNPQTGISRYTVLFTQ